MAKLANAVALFGIAVCVFLSCQKKEAAEKSTRPAEPSELDHGLTREQSARVLVKVGVTQITLGQFAERLGKLPPYLAARYDSPEGRREFLAEIVRFELLAVEAEQRGYDRRADVERAGRRAMVEEMMRDLFDEHGMKLSDVSDAEIQKYYADHRPEFEKRTLSNVRGVIQNRLWRAKRDDAIKKFVADLRGKAAIQEDPERLSKVQSDARNLGGRTEGRDR